jgi:hypothetical protein
MVASVTRIQSRLNLQTILTFKIRPVTGTSLPLSFTLTFKILSWLFANDPKACGGFHCMNWTSALCSRNFKRLDCVHMNIMVTFISWETYLLFLNKLWRESVSKQCFGKYTDFRTQTAKLSVTCLFRANSYSPCSELQATRSCPSRQKNYRLYSTELKSDTLILWRIDPLLGNVRNTHTANNTGAVFSLVLAATVAMQRVIHAASNTKGLFSIGFESRLCNESLFEATPGVYLGLFVDDTWIYATDRKDSYVLRKLQRSLSAIETRCKR